MRPGEQLLHTVLGVWREVLGDQRALDPDSNFFLSGGDSLDLLRVLVRVREQTGKELEVRDAARFSTPRRMAECCAQAPPEVQQQSQQAANAVADATRFPCTPAQVSMWLAELAAGGLALYNTAVVIHFEGPLDEDALARAIDALWQRHEILRTRLRFDAKARRLMAEAAAQRGAFVSRYLPAAMAGRQFAERAAQPFDFDEGPLWRCELTWTGERQASLLLCVHHLLIDGWSGGVLLRELAAAYGRLCTAPSARPLAQEHEFRRFALRQQQVSDADLRWWRQYLADADRGGDWPRVTARWPFALACVEAACPLELQAAIGGAARRHGVAPSVLFLAALRLALRALHGSTAVCIGVPVNVRETSAQEEALGCFVNLLVSRTAISAGMTPAEALRAVNADLLELLCRRQAAFHELARALGPTLLPSGNPWCDILFAFQNQPAASVRFAGLRARVERLAPGYGQHPLKIEICLADGRWVCRVEYARESVSVADVHALHAELARQLALLASCNS